MGFVFMFVNRTALLAAFVSLAILASSGCGGDETSSPAAPATTDAGTSVDPADSGGVGVDEVTCVDIRPLEKRVAEPTKNAVAVAFSVTSCAGEPVTGLKTADFEILEDDSPIVASEAGVTILDRDADVYVTLVLDNSPSVADAGGVDAVADAAQAFVQQVMDDDGGVSVSVIFFSKKLEMQLEYSRDQEAVLAAIEAYRTNDTGSNTTNLYGSLIEAINISKEAQATYASKMKDGVLLLGQVVMFTDGADLAAVASLDDAKSAVAGASDGVTLVAFGADADPTVLDQISSGLSLVAESPADLADLFATAGDRMVAERKAIYVMGYCSPKLAGNHQVKLKLGDKGTSPKVTFSAEGWLDDEGPECSTDKFDNACVDVECGGLWCGGCAGACNADLQCYCDDPAYKGKACDECSDPTFAGVNCDECADPTFTGANCDECSDPKYTGSGCDECADSKYTGESCDECADPKYAGVNCDECAGPFTGADCTECVDALFTGPACDECADEKFAAPDCSSTCAANLYPEGDCSIFCSPEDTCNGAGACAVDGTCICDEGIAGANCNGCDDPKFTGPPLCEECANQWTGGDCSTCPANWAGDNCDQCASNYKGESCDECANGWSGAACNVCPANWAGDNCDACAAAFAGDTCSDCSNTLNTGVGCDECLDAAFAAPDCETCAHPNKTGADCQQCKDDYYPVGECSGYCDAATSCSGQGTCTDQGKCQCEPGYGGPGCSECAPGYSGNSCDWMRIGESLDWTDWYVFVGESPDTLANQMPIGVAGTQHDIYSSDIETCEGLCLELDVENVFWDSGSLSQMQLPGVQYDLSATYSLLLGSGSPFMDHPDSATWKGMSGKDKDTNYKGYACEGGNCVWTTNSNSTLPHPCLCGVPKGGWNGPDYYSCGNGICSGEEQDWCRFDCNAEIVEPLFVGGCTPACGANECGSDGCGGSCGACAGDETCQSGVCVDDASGCTPSCGANECGSDGCGGSCGTCAAGETCNASFACESAASGHICDDYCGYQLASGCYCGDGCQMYGDCCNAAGDGYSPDCAGSTCADCN
jgi:hypothetical protein